MSKITLPISELKSALTGLGKIIAKRTTLPVLNHIKIERTKDGWTALTATDLDHFITNPKGWLPGTNMGYAGLGRGGQRADLINYLHSLSDSPVPFPKAAEAAPPGAAAEKK